MKSKESKEHYILLCPDYDYYYEDEEQCCAGSDDDEFELSDLELNSDYRFVVPGIYEWCARYVMATDFANTTTESWFDWRRWHRDGLILAKEVYRHLPRNYNLIYRKPFEDKSGLLEEVDFSKDDVEGVIRALGDIPEIPNTKPYVKHYVSFSVKNVKDAIISIFIEVGRLNFTLTISKLEELVSLKKWMEQIAADEDDIIRSASIDSRKISLNMVPQRVGQYTQMGQFRIEFENYEAWFSAYVDRREFVRNLYLTLMNHFGFGIYTNEEFRSGDYPKGLERMERWKPYNSLRSRIIEWYITDELFYNEPIPEGLDFRQVGETVSMWVDYDCCFWDTMGVGSGNEGGLSLDCGDFDMDIPGLKDWIIKWCHPGRGKRSFAPWWKEGWQLAQEVRKRLPECVDLYYMCFDPENPGDYIDYKSQLPKIIVPFQESTNTCKP